MAWAGSWSRFYARRESESGFYFPNRSLFPKVKQALKVDGIFLCKTYTVEELRYRPEFNRDYLLEPGELKRYFEDFTILLYDERDNGESCTVRIIAQRS